MKSSSSIRTRTKETVEYEVSRQHAVVQLSGVSTDIHEEYDVFKHHWCSSFNDWTAWCIFWHDGDENWSGSLSLTTWSDDQIEYLGCNLIYNPTFYLLFQCVYLLAAFEVNGSLNCYEFVQMSKMKSCLGMPFTLNLYHTQSHTWNSVLLNLFTFISMSWCHCVYAQSLAH